MKKLFLSLFASLFLLSGAGMAQTSTWINVNDTMAGADLPLRISGLIPDEAVSLILNRPDGTSLTFKQVADTFGVLSTRIHELHLQDSGPYTLYAQRGFETLTSDFMVNAGPVSAFRSEIKLLDPSVAADGDTMSQFIITLRDAFGNELANEEIKAISSRNGDQVVLAPRTNEKGIARGKVYSQEPGVSTLSFLSGDTILFEKPEIVFHLPAGGTMPNVGQGSGIGEFLRAQLFEDEAEVSYFTIEDLSTEVPIDTNVSARVVARDENGDIVPNYTGTVRFSSSDDGATLPLDYQFLPADQGQHTFFLAVRFATAGAQTLAVHDLGDFRISGEWSGLVEGDTVEIPTLGPSVTITKPNPGTYRSNRVTVTGEASECAMVKLTDGPTVLSESIPVDASSMWVFQTPTLADGIHQFQALCLENDTVMSEVVTIRIDRTPPTAMSVELTPNKCYAPGESFNVRIGSTDALSATNCIFRDSISEFTQDGEFFTMDYTAPNETGTYPLACSIFDLLGNELHEPNAGVVEVCGNDEELGEEDEEELPTENVPPTAILGLRAEPGEELVTLYWSPARDDKGIAYYRVNFAEAGSDELLEVNITPDDRTQWYVDGLTSCVNYAFQVTPIDTDGAEGVTSNVAEGMPFCRPGDEPPKPPVTGPESGVKYFIPLVMILLATMGGLILIRSRKA